MIVLTGVDDNFLENDDTIVGDGVGEIFAAVVDTGVIVLKKWLVQFW